MDYFEFAEALDELLKYRRGESAPRFPVPAVIYAADLFEYGLDFIPVINGSEGKDRLVACWDDASGKMEYGVCRDFTEEFLLRETFVED